MRDTCETLAPWFWDYDSDDADGPTSERIYRTLNLAGGGQQPHRGKGIWAFSDMGLGQIVVLLLWRPNWANASSRQTGCSGGGFCGPEKQKARMLLTVSCEFMILM